MGPVFTPRKNVISGLTVLMEEVMNLIAPAIFLSDSSAKTNIVFCRAKDVMVLLIVMIGRCWFQNQYSIMNLYELSYFYYSINLIDRSDEEGYRCDDANQFHCLQSGECIQRDKKCDGRTDCVDGSDETAENCSDGDRQKRPTDGSVVPSGKSR